MGASVSRLANEAVAEGRTGFGECVAVEVTVETVDRVGDGVDRRLARDGELFDGWEDSLLAREGPEELSELAEEERLTDLALASAE